MLTATIDTRQLSRFNATLQEYQRVTGKNIDEVLEKKGRDVGIKLFQEFSGRKWGGPGKNKKIAAAELAIRTAQGRGTRVRSSLVTEYKRQREGMNSFSRSIGQRVSSRNFRGTLDQWSALKNRQTANRKQRAKLWRQTVGKEVQLRQQGIGVLAASFLWYRSRSNNTRGTFYVRNKTGRSLGYVEKGSGFLRIASQVAGADVVDARYNLVNRALVGATDDMRQHLLRKQRESFSKLTGFRAA